MGSPLDATRLGSASVGLEGKLRVGFLSIEIYRGASIVIPVPR